MNQTVDRKDLDRAEADLCRVLAAATGRESTDADVTSCARLAMPVIRSLLPGPVSELTEAYARVLRNKRMRDEYAHGRSQPELAAAYKLDVRTVRRIVRRGRRIPPAAPIRPDPGHHRCSCGGVISNLEWERHRFRKCRDCMGL